MKELLEKLLEAVELGKVDKKSPYPPQLKDQDGADFYSPDPQEAVNYLKNLASLRFNL